MSGKPSLLRQGKSPPLADGEGGGGGAPCGSRESPGQGALRYRRVLVKVSGEALAGGRKAVFDPDMALRVTDEISRVRAVGVDVAIVVGGGNIFRGADGARLGVDRAVGDHMGMMATVINALYLGCAFEKAGMEVRVMSALPMAGVCEPYVRARALHHLRQKRIVLLAAGTGNPFFSTDSAAALRALELNCDALCKATKVDGIYTKDPASGRDARRYAYVSYTDVLAQNLAVMDGAAVALARAGELPVLVFSITTPLALFNALQGRGAFTLIGKGRTDDRRAMKPSP